MKHLIFQSRFLILLLGFLTIGISHAWGETVEFYSENFGKNTSSAKTFTKTTDFSDKTTWDKLTTEWKQAKNTTNASSGYTGASGNSSASTSTSNATLVLKFGDISAYSDVVLSFGYYNNAGTSKARTFKAEVSANGGSTWTNLECNASRKTQTWELVTYDVPSASLKNFAIRFTNTSTNASHVDDIKLTGTLAAADPSIEAEDELLLDPEGADGTFEVKWTAMEDVDVALYTDLACTNKFDGDWFKVDLDGDKNVEYVAEANTEKDSRTVYMQLYGIDADVNDYTKVVTVTQSGAGDGDKITCSKVGVCGSSSYSDWKNDFNGVSGAVYKGSSAGSNNSIQLRSSDDPSGIVSTTSGGIITKVKVEWESNTANGRVLNIFGSHDPYTSVADLRDDSKKGTLLGTITNGTSTELSITADEYEYVGVCSNSGAMYLTSVTFVWEAPVLNVSFDLNGGTGTQPDKITDFPTYLPSTSDFTKTGCRPNGWNTQADGKGTHYADGASFSAPAASVKLYVEWVNVYSVTYKGNYATDGDTPVDGTVYDENSNVTVLGNTGNLVRTGYIWSGWNTQADGEGTTYAQGATFKITANTNLYAKWVAKTTEITLDQQEGTGGSTSVTATYGQAMPTATMPSRTGHDFKGYYDAKTDGTQYYYINGNSVRSWNKEDATATLYARWQAQEYIITYRDQNDGAFHGTWPDPDTHPKKHTYGVETQLVNPTRTGYTFDGWFGNQACEGVAITAIAGDAYTASFNIYAKWTAKNYTVTFNKNSEEAGGSMDPQPFAFDEQKALTENNFTAPAHKHFAGWAKTSDGAVAYADKANYKLTTEGAELFAVWAWNQTEIALDKQGGTGGSAKVTATYGSAMPSAGNVPAKTGYDFKGYYTEENGQGTQYYSSTNTSVQNWDKDDATLTLYAYWTPKTITIKLNKGDHGTADGTTKFVYNTKTYASFTPVEPTTGYTLDGYFTTATGGSMVLDAEGKLGNQLGSWIDAEGNWIKSSDDELHAHYTPINYPITWLVNGTEWTGKGGSTEAAYDSKIAAVPTTLPTTSECDDEKVFMGWTNQEITTGAKPDVLFTKVADAPTITGETKYYAVFAKASSEGAAPVNTVLWGETFDHFGTNTPSTAGTGTGTTIYGGASITYAQSNNNTKGYSTDLSSGGKEAPELLLSKDNQTWTISGIKSGKAKKSSLVFVSNRTTFSLTCSSDAYKVEGSQKSWTLTLKEGQTAPETFNLVLKNTGSNNARVDDVVLKITEAGITYSEYITQCCTPYSITLENNGTVTGGTFSITPSQACEGAVITISNTPETGYSFVKYTFTKTEGGQEIDPDELTFIGEEFLMPNYDITIAATFTNQYTITFDNQEATTAGIESTTATYGQAMPSIAGNLPEKTNYNFGGYFDAKEGTGTQYYNADGTSAKNWDKTIATTLYAYWLPITSRTISYLGDEHLTYSEKPISVDGAEEDELTIEYTVNSGYEIKGVTVKVGETTLTNSEITYDETKLYIRPEAGFNADVTITFNIDLIHATEITLSETSAEIMQGKSLQLMATVLPDVVLNKDVTWTSSDASGKISVNADGLVSVARDAEKDATATITATSVDNNQVYASCTITVLENANWFGLYDKAGDEMEDGEYIIYYDGNVLKNATSDTRIANTSDIAPVEHIISIDDDALAASIVWEIKKSGDYWTIYNTAVQKYAASTGTEKEATLSDEDSEGKALWTITKTDDAKNETYDIINKKNKDSDVKAYLRYNNSGATFWACYAYGQSGPVSLYKKGYKPKAALISVALEGTLSKTEYIAGDKVSIAGLTVMGGYNDGTSAAVAFDDIQWSFEPETLTESTSSVSITATVGELTDTKSYDVNVSAIPQEHVYGYFNFTTSGADISSTDWNDNDKWSTSYTEHTITADEADVIFKGANKSTTTITTMPIVKGSAIILQLKESNKQLTSAAMATQQWSDKEQDLSIEVSRDNVSWTKLDAAGTETTGISAAINKNDIRFVKFLFSSNSNQIGIVSISFTTSDIQYDYKRTDLVVGNYGTLCVPYAVKATDRSGATFWNIETSNTPGYTNPTSVTIVEEEGDLVAGKPYIFCATETEMAMFFSGEEYKLEEHDNATVPANGLFGNLTDDDYIINEKANPQPTDEPTRGFFFVLQQKLYECGWNCTVGPNRGWVQAAEIEDNTTPSPAPRRVIGNPNGTPTGINNLNTDGWKNIQGARKFFHNNNIVIVNEGRIYNAQGIRIQ